MADVNEQISGYGMSISDIQRQRSEINEIDVKALQERYDMERELQLKLSSDEFKKWQEFQKKKDKHRKEIESKIRDDQIKAAKEIAKITDDKELKRQARAKVHEL